MKRQIVILLAIMLCACGPKAPTWQEQYDLGLRYLLEGNYEEAIIAFTAAIEIDPKQAPAYVGRGDAYVLSGETEENLAAAQADYEKAIELDETLADAYLRLADVYIYREEDYNALKVLQQGYGKTDKDEDIAAKMQEIKNDNTITENPIHLDILNGYWETNGYRLSDVCVYQFRPDGTYICQTGIGSPYVYGEYEYIDQTLTLFFKISDRNEVDNIYYYDSEKHIFVSSQRTVLVEQAFGNADGIDKFAAETLSFSEEPPLGFFDDKLILTKPENVQETKPNISNTNLYPIDYIGMTVNSLAELWGGDYQLANYWYAGTAKPIYYLDGRIPMMFYFLDPEFTNTVHGDEKIALVEISSASVNEVAPGVPREVTYSKLLELGYRGELLEQGKDYFEGDSDETAIFYMEYSPGISIYFYWYDFKDPQTTPAEWIMIWGVESVL